MKKSKRVMISLSILLAGVLITAGLVLLKPKASRSVKEYPIPTVEIVKAVSNAVTAKVSTTGTVTASKEVTIIPEVNGRIVYQSDRLIPGGRFKKGELLARIDSRDYSLAVQQYESQVAQARLELKLEKNRQKTAQEEWKLLGGDQAEGAGSLALRKPHLAASQENLKAAKANLERAKLNLYRTTLRAPFNAIVVNENIDVGQVVGPSSVVTKLVGTDRFWVKASLPVEKLNLLLVPGFNAETGSVVQIAQSLGGGDQVVRNGQLVGLEGSLDPQTRTAQLLIALEHPMDPPAGKKPILYGAYVDLEIVGREIEGTVEVPRGAIVQGRKVWVVDENNLLASRDVEVGWGDEKSAAVTHGLNEGDRILVTNLALPIVGMPVKIRSAEIQRETTEKSMEGGDES